MELDELEEHLRAARWYVENSPRRAACAELTLDDKAHIYGYTDQGYQPLNRALWRLPGAVTLPFARGLIGALAKLPPYAGQVFHGARFGDEELAYYHACWQRGTEVVWPTFLSATTEQTIAEDYATNVLLAIYSQSGRAVEALSAHGQYHPPFQNEHEVLFTPGTRFLVEDISQEGALTVITLVE